MIWHPVWNPETQGLQRPKQETKRPPRRRVTLAGAPPAAINSYAAFCSLSAALLSFFPAKTI